jgi:hypothetical protein
VPKFPESEQLFQLHITVASKYFMDKRDNILFIKYVLNCIDNFENNFKEVNKHFEITNAEINQTLQNINNHSTQLKELFPNDTIIDNLIKAEISDAHLYDTANQQDKRLITEYLNNIDISLPLDITKQEFCIFLEQLKSKSTHHYQLSEIIYGCVNL